MKKNYVIYSAMLVLSLLVIGCTNTTDGNQSGEGNKAFDFSSSTVYAITDVSGQTTSAMSLNVEKSTALLSVYDETAKSYTGFMGTYEDSRAASSGSKDVTIKKIAHSTTLSGLETATYEGISTEIKITVTVYENNQISLKVETAEIASELKLPAAAATNDGIALTEGSIENTNVMNWYNNDKRTVVEGALKATAVTGGVELSIDKTKLPAAAFGQIGIVLNGQYIAWRDGYKYTDNNRTADTATYFYPFVDVGKTYNFWLYTEHNGGKILTIKSDLVKVTATSGLGESLCSGSFGVKFDLDTNILTISNVTKPEFISALEGNSRYKVQARCQVHHPAKAGESTSWLCEKDIPEGKLEVNFKYDVEDGISSCNFLTEPYQKWDNCWVQMYYAITDTESGITWQSASISSRNTFTFGTGNTTTPAGTSNSTLLYMFTNNYSDTERNVQGGTIISLFEDGKASYRWTELNNNTGVFSEWYYYNDGSNTPTWKIRDNGIIAVTANQCRNILFTPSLNSDEYAVLTGTGFEESDPENPTDTHDPTGDIYTDYLHEQKTISYLKK